MFNSLTGIVTGRSTTGVYLSVGGVEWELETSSRTIRELSSVDGETRVFTHLYHREDQMRLFGFASEAERRVFLELIRVSGVGPRAAVKILSAASPQELIRALEAEDVDALTRLPGLGKKTAQKIILTLRGSLTADSEGTGGFAEELVASLVDMGFDRNRAIRAVSRLIADAGDEATLQESEVLRRAIVELSSE
ncbi:MAG: Holliday junction branch migration protein RuvA [Spirochaetales bacterium]